MKTIKDLEENGLELNNIYNCDCLEGLKRLEDNSVDLVIIDPPYYQVKGDFDFILSFEEWQELHLKLAIECRRVLKENGSLFLYGHSKNIAYQQIIFDKYFNLENNLVWYKSDCRTRLGRKNFRCFAPVTERILFYSQKWDTDSGKLINDKILEENLKPNNNFAKYLKSEFERAGVTNREIASLFPSRNGGLTGCVSNWLNGDNIITKEQYLKIREYLNNEYLKAEYEDLKAEYEDLKAEYEDLRRYFNNTKYDDVLMFAQDVQDSAKFKHPTQKTVKLTKVLIETTTKKDAIVLITFVGSGTECFACKELDRNFIGFEIIEEYCNMAEERLKKVNNKKLNEWFKK